MLGSNFASGRRIGLGCMALTGIYGRIEHADAIAVIHRALDLGIDHFDTAELYGPYTNEELLAEALGVDGQRVTIATKFGYKIKNGQIAGLDSRPSTIRLAVEGSLRRLRRERIDLLYQHRVDPEVAIEDVVGTVADLISEGKIGALGLSAINSTMLERAQKVHAVAAIQNEYSLIQRQAEADLFPVLQDQAAVFVAYSPLGRGILTGDAIAASSRPNGDYRAKDMRFSENHLSTTANLLQPLWNIARQREVSPVVVALAWILGRSPSAVVIPGAKSPNQIATCMLATSLLLTEAEHALLDAIRIPSPRTFEARPI